MERREGRKDLLYDLAIAIQDKEIEHGEADDLFRSCRATTLSGDSCQS